MRDAGQRGHRRPVAAILSIFASLGIAGCTVGPDFVRPRPTLPASWRSTGAEPAPAVAADAPWWHAFGDPVLDGLEERAGAANLDVRIALERVEAGRAARGIAKAGLLPTIAGQAAYSRQRLATDGIAPVLAPLLGLERAPDAPKSFDFNVYSTGLSATWELDLWGKRRREIEGARASVEAAEAEAGGARHLVNCEIARTYFQLRGLWAERALAERGQALAMRTVQIAELLRQRGLATQIDVAEAQSRQRQSAADIIELEEQAATAERALAVLIGAEPDAPPVERRVDYALPEQPAAALRLPSEMARRRPDILAAEARLHAATAAVGVAQADFYPSINLSGLFSIDVLHLADFGWDARNTDFGPAVSIPIFSGGRLRRQMELRRSEARAAALQYQSTVRTAWREVDDALGSLQAAARRGALVDQELTSRRQIGAAVGARLRRGDVSEVSVLEARAREMTAEADSLRQRVAAILATVQLHRALGN